MTDLWKFFESKFLKLLENFNLYLINFQIQVSTYALKFLKMSLVKWNFKMLSDYFKKYSPFTNGVFRFIDNFQNPSDINFESAVFLQGGKIIKTMEFSSFFQFLWCPIHLHCPTRIYVVLNYIMKYSKKKRNYILLLPSKNP